MKPRRAAPERDRGDESLSFEQRGAITFGKPAQPKRVSEISAWTERIFVHGMCPHPDAFFLAKLVMTEGQLDRAAHPDLIWDQKTITVLRSVLMKPEHADLVPALHERVIESTKRTNV